MPNVAKPKFRIITANDNHERRGPRPVSQLSDRELANLEENLTRAGATAGPHYSLQEVRIEMFRRKTNGIDGAAVTEAIIKLAASAKGYQVTYLELFKYLWPKEVWRGHKAVTKIMQALGASLLHCVLHDLPVVTALVVKTKERYLSANAVRNICAACQRLGREVGRDAERFVVTEALCAMDIVDLRRKLPAA